MSLTRVRQPARTAGAQGFSLLEVMVTLVVIGFGLLGVMRMQASAMASTSSAGTRALVALQARSLAAAMRGNAAYWADPAVVTTSFALAGLALTDAGTLSDQAADCVAARCSPVQLASFDLRQWAAGMNQLVPGYRAAGDCAVAAGAPVRCRLTVAWQERQLGVNASTNATASNAVPQSFTLVVQP